MDTKAPVIEIKENTDYLSNVVGDMPSISPVAETIAQKVKDAQQEQIPNAPAGGKRARGRPKKIEGQKPTAINAKTSGSRLGGVSTPEERNNAAVDAERNATATFIAGAVEVSGMALGGEEAKMNDMEKMGMVAVWDKYLLSKGVNDIPPGMALCLVMSQYYGRVLTTKKAQPKVQSFVLKIRDKIMEHKYARSLRWNDRKRQNDTRETTDKGVPGEGD